VDLTRYTLDGVAPATVESPTSADDVARVKCPVYGFYAENVSRILINSGQLGLPQVFWQPSEELIPEQYGIGPILFLVLTHKRIVSRIGFSDPLLSDFSLFILDGAAVLFIESEEQFAILFFVSIHHIPDIIY